MAGLNTESEVAEAYRLYGPELYRFLLRGLTDHGAAQDVCQETFLKAWRYADRFDSELSSLRGWLFGIARNTMIDHLRASRVRPWQRDLFDVAEHADSAQTTEDHAEQVLSQWLIEEALRQISGIHREAIIRTHLNQEPYDQIALDLGVPIGTVRSRVFYGLKALRKVMDEMGVSL